MARAVEPEASTPVQAAQAPVTEAGEVDLDALAAKGGDGKAEAHGLGGPSTEDSTVATSRPPQDEHSAEQAASREDSTRPGASTGAHDVDPRDPEPWAGQAAAASPKAEGEPATIWDGEAAAELAAALQRVHATQRVQERVLGDTFAALQMAVAELRARDAQRASELAALRDATAGLVRRVGELAGDVHELRERDIERAFADDTAAKAAAAARAAEMERIDAHVGPRLPGRAPLRPARARCADAPRGVWQLSETQAAVRAFDQRLCGAEADGAAAAAGLAGSALGGAAAGGRRLRVKGDDSPLRSLATATFSPGAGSPAGPEDGAGGGGSAAGAGEEEEGLMAATLFRTGASWQLGPTSEIRRSPHPFFPRRTPAKRSAAGGGGGGGGGGGPAAREEPFRVGESVVGLFERRAPHPACPTTHPSAPGGGADALRGTADAHKAL